MIPLHRVFMAPDAAAAVEAVLYSGYLGEGDAVEVFEQSLKDYFEYEFVLTVNSATSGLYLALRLLNIHVGGEVLTTPLTCMATTSAIRANLLTPIWVDVDPETLNMDLDDLESKITANTRAIMAVHFAGNPIDLDRLHKLSIKHNLPIVEDCAHALGAAVYQAASDNQPVRIGVYSFQAVKPVTCGDGGAMLLPEKLYDRARRLRWYGIDRKDRSRPVTETGFKFHMNNVSAAIGRANLVYVNDILSKYRENAAAYSVAIPAENRITWAPGASYYLYPISVERRPDFIRAMHYRGVEVGPVHTRNDLEPCFEYLRNPTPKLDSFHENIVCLPVGWWVGPTEQRQVIAALNKGW